jgi:hypothetical protein
MGASADVNWIDKEVFLPMLESDWNSKIKKLNVKQREIAENKTVDWVRQQFIKKIKS